MAGYMTKMQGQLYDGEFVNGLAVATENGVLLVPGTSTNKGKLVAPSADGTTQLLCREVTDIYDGVTAYRFVVNKLNANYYFVENGAEVNDSDAYDARTYKTAVGDYLRAHPVQVGDEFVTTMVTGTPVAGTAYGIDNTGKPGYVAG